MEACVDLNWGPREAPWNSTGGGFYPRTWWRAMGSPCCWTAQWHTAVYRADPSHVVRPCFGFQGSITFPLSSSPAGTSG